MAWNPGFPVNFTPSGDSVSESIQKHINEINEIYAKLCRIRSLDSSPTPPADAWKGCLWIDSSNPSKPILKVFNGSTWVTAFDTSAIDTAIEEARATAVPVGTITVFAGTSPPSGWWECNGYRYDTARCPNLYSVLGSDLLPDLRGYFVRGLDTAGVFVTQNGRVRGSVELPCNCYHRHDVFVAPDPILGSTHPSFWPYLGSGGHVGGVVLPDRPYRISAEVIDAPIRNEHGHFVAGGDGLLQDGFTESRPYNKAYMYIIKHD